MRFRKFQIKSFVMQSGERYCLLFDKTTGMPLFYPNLFVTTQVRNKSNLVTAMESALSSINVLQSFFDERGLDLTDRFLKQEVFSLVNWMRSVTIANRILARDVLNCLKKLDPSLPKSRRNPLAKPDSRANTYAFHRLPSMWNGWRQSC